MSETPSTMLPLGTKATPFTLIDVRSNKSLSLDDIKSNTATVIMFICNHCPYVKHIQKKLIETVNFYQKKDVRFIAINSNDAKHYPADAPFQMRKVAEKFAYSFPYLYDETQAVAKAYHAACTPDFFVFDKELKCIYRGRFDESTPGNTYPVTGKELSQALENILAGKPVDPDQKPSVGCNIKWKK
ncbi:MAG TPA: thioredoxin family protein [Gammaproteobacteria bacterium]|nr:thioredoxin family protein [Gammaproteobacteria bacterium]